MTGHGGGVFAEVAQFAMFSESFQRTSLGARPKRIIFIRMART